MTKSALQIARAATMQIMPTPLHWLSKPENAGPE